MSGLPEMIDTLETKLKEREEELDSIREKVIALELANSDITRLKTCEAAWLGVVEALQPDPHFQKLTNEMSHAGAAKTWVQGMVQDYADIGSGDKGTTNVSNVPAVQENRPLVGKCRVEITGRILCTKDSPWNPELPGNVAHPDAELVSSGEYRDLYRCPHCNTTFHVELPE
jgi:hypothetical protein